MSKTDLSPTEAEFKILNVLWQNGPLTVRAIHDQLETSSGYTTTLKLLQIMTTKKLVTRDESSRAHIYSAALSKDSAKQKEVKSLAGKLFGGSVLKLALGALSEKKCSAEDLQKIKELVAQMEDEQSTKM
ncbi:BlaI/MecI/CopY family transcriptional regulator [Persicirhabdus sediminis]|uniref:BlaI/MecI/CopY family transcriptional regulator n=1 Tax=Persicirhabdus sediminis TaxID=454144 RepID=A0A8J7MBT8_9BACT|nr:BlaI/MecI/CopY family transcriptional regulator [Persicirhabdus sediminis]MBK1789703.1 BlaI/MecI/CopY family transcriptional regulator [Persicirhabdus sediminis]